MRGPIRIYLAGPLGFSELGRAQQERLVRHVMDLGYEILDPFRLTPQEEFDRIARLGSLEQQREAWRALKGRVGETNRQAIDDSDGVLAILDGTDVDSGTAAEIGYACAREKPVVGYRGDFRLASDNPGSIVNLQVEYFIHRSGGEIVTSLDAIGAALARLFE